ncbi:hypothetical protein CJ999_30725 [Bacillus thuringiensis]|nr:hypothetical protein [Bacillus thuringiensis]
MINEQTPLQNDLGLLDFDVVESIMNFEQEFGIQIPDEVSVHTIPTLIDYISENTNQVKKSELLKEETRSSIRTGLFFLNG